MRRGGRLLVSKMEENLTKESLVQGMLDRWIAAVRSRWEDVHNKASSGCVACPQKSVRCGALEIHMNLNGVNPAIAGSHTSLKDIVYDSRIDVSKIPDFRAGVMKAIEEADVEVNEAIKRRGEAWDAIADCLKIDIAEHELTKKDHKP